MLLALCLQVLSKDLPAPDRVVAGAPEIVRVGLEYQGSARSEIPLLSASGMTVGVEANDGTWHPVFSSEPGLELRVWKDGLSGNPWHIVAETGLADARTAVSRAAGLSSQGYPSWPARADGRWQVFTGRYADEASATAAASQLSRETGLTGVTVLRSVSPTAADRSRSFLVVGHADGGIRFFFASGTEQLKVSPNAAAGAEPVSVPPLIGFSAASRYRGALAFSRREGSDITVVNVLTMDEYLYGVVPVEIGAASPAEAVKAQAVVARTYAVHCISSGKHAGYGFDLCPTVCCQSYGGYAVEGTACSGYIAETTGQVVTYTWPSGAQAGKKELAQVFYFSTSGGWTESCENVWVASLPYLVAVPDPYEPSDLPYSNWTVQRTADQVIQMTGGSLSRVAGIDILSLTQAGRVLNLAVRGTASDGSPVTLSYAKEKTRSTFQLRSMWYRITSDADASVLTGSGEVVRRSIGGSTAVIGGGGILRTSSSPGSVNTLIGSGGRTAGVPALPTLFTFTGKGWGHAVGMSQNGAIGMAGTGKTYREIITHYFTGTVVE